MIESILPIFTFIAGSMIGSFLNVVIHRIPLGQSIVFPRSKCPSCDKLIKWYQNFPLLSYIFLRGKCEKCGAKISIRYPLVELMTGLLALWLFQSPDLVINFFLFNVGCTLICIFFIDLDHKIIPDKLNLYLLLLFMMYALIYLPPYHWIAGGVIGFFGPLGVTWVFYKLRNQVGLGGGDIKLFGVLGVYLGPMGIMSNIFMSSFLGATVGLILIAMKKYNPKNTLAFGPYIVIISFIQIFFPNLFAKVNPFTF